MAIAKDLWASRVQATAHSSITWDCGQVEARRQGANASVARPCGLWPGTGNDQWGIPLSRIISTAAATAASAEEQRLGRHRIDRRIATGFGCIRTIITGFIIDRDDL